MKGRMEFSVVVFPDTRDKFKYIIYEGNNLVLCGSVRKNDNSLVSIIEFVDFKKENTTNEDSKSEVKDEAKSGDETKK